MLNRISEKFQEGFFIVETHVISCVETQCIASLRPAYIDRMYLLSFPFNTYRIFKFFNGFTYSVKRGRVCQKSQRYKGIKIYMKFCSI